MKRITNTRFVDQDHNKRLAIGKAYHGPKTFSTEHWSTTLYTIKQMIKQTIKNPMYWT